MEIKVSVIVPAYNAEKYVLHAVDSALSQTLGGIEIIVVDDCSTDGTLALLKGRYAENGRVKIVSQPENAGVSAARNRGLREARGEYVVFLDSDDAMLPDMLENMYRAAKQCDSDVLHTTGCLLPAVVPVPDNMTGLSPEQFKPLIPEKCDPGSGISHAPSDRLSRLSEWYAHKYHWSVWNKLFRRSFLEDNGITFDRLSMAEDMVFCFKALFLAKEYTVLPGQWYVYRIGIASLSRDKSGVGAVVKLTANQIRAAEAIDRFTSSEPFFKSNPGEAIKVRKAVCDSIDRYYLVPALEKCGVEARESGAISELFEKEYGEKGAFVSYLYWRLHELLSDGVNVADIISNASEFSRKADELRNGNKEGEKK